MKTILRVAYRCAYKLALCYWFVFRPTQRGAYVAVWSKGKLLLIKNSYKAGYTLPSGGVKKYESIESAAVRELAEEVGIQASPDDLRLIDEFKSTSEFKTDRSTVYELHLAEQPAITIDNIEVTAFEFVSMPEVKTRKLTSIANQYVDHLSAT